MYCYNSIGINSKQSFFWKNDLLSKLKIKRKTKMTNIRKNKLTMALIKTAEIKVIFKDLNLNTYLLDLILSELRYKINKSEFNSPSKPESIYSYMVEANFLMDKLQVYKRSENIKNKLSNLLNNLKTEVENKDLILIEER